MPGPPFSHMRSFSVLRLGGRSTSIMAESSPLAKASSAALRAARAARASATPSGTKAGRSLSSRALGTATVMRLRTEPSFLLLVFISTRRLSSRVHARSLTSAMLSSAAALMGMISALASRAMSSRSLRCSAERLSKGATSILLATITSGLLANSGRMFSKRATCCSIVQPHCSERSTKYMTQHCKCARAVTACISMVLRSSSGLSRIPGVSITCQREY
mmetsp:Transcript_18482/g.53089  ORF Transcript_18482/g.53089 Transcript_18482/m.53089 type:complete len:219 (-) Transcript_18482:738-1394(-)